jgi:hypothetical protein
MPPLDCTIFDILMCELDESDDIGRPFAKGTSSRAAQIKLIGTSLSRNLFLMSILSRKATEGREIKIGLVTRLRTMRSGHPSCMSSLCLILIMAKQLELTSATVIEKRHGGESV